jgi:tetratricopeptide (TPR) repeat protein
LFEHARAGTEAGLSELVLSAQAGLEEIPKTTDSNLSLVTSLTKGFCEIFFQDPGAAQLSLQKAAALSGSTANKALLSFIYSGIGLALTHLGRLQEAEHVFARSLELARKVGDDVRASTIAANLCTVNVARGEYDEAIRYGTMSIDCARANAKNNPTLVTSYTNLADAYVLTGRADEAVACIESARAWLGSERRWRIRCAFLTEAAAFALIQANTQLALDLIAQLETLVQGREGAFPMPGSFWKLRLFRAAHLGKAEEALCSASTIGEGFRAKCPYHFLDLIGLRAWLERRVNGNHSTETDEDLQLFDKLGAPGKKALLAAQGFLP